MDFSKYTHILWDFNGTLLDDVDATIAANNILLSRRGLPEIHDREIYYRLVDCPIREFYLRMGFDLDKENFIDIAAEWTDAYLMTAADATLREGAESCLEYFRRLGLVQSVLSASRDSILEEQISRLGIRKYFSLIIGLDNSHTVDKSAAAKEWRENNPGTIPLVIGDSEHDARVAKSVGADCILVCGGHRSRKTLSQFSYPIIDSLNELI